MSTIAVFGASGFVGTEIVNMLLEGGHHEVRPLAASTGNSWRLLRRGIPVQQVDLLDRAAVAAAIDGCDVVVNAARGEKNAMLDGLDNLLRCATRANVERFVHFSSVAVYGDPPPPESIDESALTSPLAGSYGAIKLEQDHRVMKAARRGLRSVVLCPPNIGGAESPFLLQVLGALRRGHLALIEDGSTPCCLVDVANLAGAVDSAIHSDVVDGRRLFITDDAATTWREVVDALRGCGDGFDDPPAIDRGALRSPADIPAPRSSLVGAIKHLASSDVREALRRNPVLERIDTGVRGLVGRVSWLEDRLRSGIEGPIKVSKIDDADSIDERLSAQQLRGVHHSCSRAKTEIGYRPRYDARRGFAAFQTWYNWVHGVGEADWPMIRQLSP